jgi:hypothetical protein
MTIVLLMEGETEAALKVHLKAFLDQRAALEGKPSVRLKTKPEVGRSKGAFHKRVRLELAEPGVRAVVALVDVYPDYSDAAAAKRDLYDKAGAPANFFAHAAQYDVEAWLLSFWDGICGHLQVTQSPPGANPEEIDADRPPSKRLRELYGRAKQPKRSYSKVTEMRRLLKDKDLTVIASQCPEFKLFLNTLLTLSDLTPLP